MSEEKKCTKEECSKRFAVDLFNMTWDLIEKKDRTKEDDDKMVHAAHASRFHWGEVGEPINFERGEWQISRVYAILNRPESSLRHAKRCMEICTENEIGDFDIAFAYEAMARAYSFMDDGTKKDKYVKLAEEAGKKIEESGNRDYFTAELASVKQ